MRATGLAWQGVRFGIVLVLATFLAFGISRTSFAQTPGVPADIQASLVFKLLTYDRSFAARVGSVVRVVVLAKRGSARSSLSAESFKTAFSGLGKVGGIPQEVGITLYGGAPALAELCRKEHVAAVYVTTDFDDEIPSLQRALDGVDVLSISAVPEYVPQGIVIGFELVSGKPKILLNLPQARRQNVNFDAEVLRLMKVLR